MKPRTDPDALTTQARLVGAASRVFVREGYGRASVEQILREAELSRRTFYQYFESKEDVLAALYEQRMDALVGDLMQAMQHESDPVQRVLGAIDAWLDHVIVDGALAASYMTEAQRPGSKLAARREATLDLIAGAIDGTVQSVLGRKLDPWLFRALAVGIESLAVYAGPADGLARERSRVRRVAGGLVLTVLAHPESLPEPPRGRGKPRV